MAKSHPRRPAARSTVKGLTRSNRWRPLAMLEEEEERALQPDRLSDLPDDVLLSIMGRLDFADATRTGILSRRWKHIPAMLSTIRITVCPAEIMPGRTRDVAQANAAVLGAARSLLQSRSGRTSASTVARWKVSVVEFTVLTEKGGRHYSLGDVSACGRQLNSLVYDCRDAFSCLTRLKLESLNLGESDFPRIFRLCERLEILRLSRCDMGFRSLMEVEHPRLRELEIFCCGFERVDLNWLPELTTLSFSSWMSLHDPFSFGYVPLLNTVSIRNVAFLWHEMLKLSELLAKATMSNLHLGFQREKIWVKPEDPRELLQVFNKLRLVDLAAISEECDLNWTMFILQGAPSLEELCIRVCECLRKQDKEIRKRIWLSEVKDPCAQWEASDFKHHNLSVLRIFGFQSEDKFVDYLRAVMEAAVNLKDIYLHEKPACMDAVENSGQRGCKYPRSEEDKICVRSSLNMHMRPLLRLHFGS